MKTLFLLLAMLPFAVFAQSKTDYEKTMQRYAKLYNKGDVKKIAGMFGSDHGKHFYTPELYNRTHCDYGRLLCYEYLGPDETDPEKVIVFRTVYEKSTHAMSFTLDEHIKLGTFRIKTSSDEIDKMME